MSNNNEQMNIATRIAFATAAALTATAITMDILIQSGVKGVLTALIDTFGVEAGLEIASNGSDACFSYACVVFFAGMVIEAIVGGATISTRDAARYF